MKTAYVLAIVLSIAIFDVILEWVSTFVFNDWEGASYVLVAVLVDAAAKAWKTWGSSDFSWRLLMKGFFTKCIRYSLLLIIAHVVNAATVNGDNMLISKLDEAIYTSVYMYEIISIFNNLGWIKWITDFLPPALQKHFRK